MINMIIRLPMEIVCILNIRQRLEALKAVDIEFTKNLTKYKWKGAVIQGITFKERSDLST